MSRIGAATPLDDLTEKAWQRQIVELARTLGWHCWHCHDARRTVPGMPDLILIRERLLWVELKTETGKLTDNQAAFHDRLIAAGQTVFVWRPRDWEDAGMQLARREHRRVA